MLAGAEMALAVVTAMFMFIMVVGVSVAISVAVSGFGILSNILREARSHLTWKCLRRDGHEVTTDRDVFWRSLYHSLALKPDLHLR